MTVFKSDTAKPVLLSEKDWFDVDVISCAAPNLRYMLQYDKNWKKTVTDKKLFDIYKKRINRVLDIASSAKSELLDVEPLQIRRSWLRKQCMQQLTNINMILKLSN